MKVIFSKKITRKELGTKPAEKDVELILKAYSKGLYDPIKGEGLPPASSLIKIYATSLDGARRIVFMVDEETKEAFFLFFRTKNDLIGENITIKNPVFRKTLHTYLGMLMEDVRSGDFETKECP